MVDLRSDEERRLAPTRLAGQVHQDAVSYSMMALFAGAQGGKMPSNGGRSVASSHAAGAAGRLVFDRLKAQAGPIEYNCSAGQDRTGFMTALILAALGTPARGDPAIMTCPPHCAGRNGKCRKSMRPRPAIRWRRCLPDTRPTRHGPAATAA
jgi:hypothetical protein